MFFRGVLRDVRDGFGSLSRRSFEVRFSGHNRGKSQGSVCELHDEAPVVQQSRWASLPPELLRDVIKRLEASESTWPSRKHVVACAAVCRSWRKMCKEIVRNPELSGKLTFPVSLKQPGPRDGTIECFIKRDKSTLIISTCVLVHASAWLLVLLRTLFASVSFSNSSSSIMFDRSMDFSSSRFSDMGSSFMVGENGAESEREVRPLLLRNKSFEVA